MPEPVAGCLGDPLYGPYRSIAPIFDVIDHDPHPLGEAHLRLPTELGADLGNIGPGALGFPRPLGNVDGDRSAEQADELVNAGRSATPHIVCLPGSAAISRDQQRIDRIADEGEVARL